MANVYDKDETFALCESLGAPTVKEWLLLGKFHVGRKPHAEAWLSLHEASVKDRAMTLEEEHIAIAREANVIALAAATLDSEANAIARRDKKHSIIETVISIAIAIKTAIWR